MSAVVSSSVRITASAARRASRSRAAVLRPARPTARPPVRCPAVSAWRRGSPGGVPRTRSRSRLPPSPMFAIIGRVRARFAASTPRGARRAPRCRPLYPSTNIPQPVGPPTSSSQVRRTRVSELRTPTSRNGDDFTRRRGNCSRTPMTGGVPPAARGEVQVQEHGQGGVAYRTRCLLSTNSMTAARRAFDLRCPRSLPLLISAS